MICYILSSLIILITIILTSVIGIVSKTSQNKIGGNQTYINDEYSRWLKSKEIEKMINKTQNPHEVHNIIERWLITNANLSNDIFVSDSETDKKLLSEFKEKNIPDGNTFLDNMKLLQLTPDGSIGNITVQIEPNCRLIYKEFTFNITPERLEILRKTGSDEQITRAALKYESLLPQGQQWAIPLSEYQHFIDDGATVEGFASPFNSQIIRLGDYKFCSLFIDSDSQFGSIGNFFLQDFSNTYAIVNPPFVESILEKAANKCLEELAKHKCKFAFYGPSWRDSQFYQILSDSKFLVEKQNLRSGDYNYEDLFRNKIVKANFNSTTWTLSS